jgi:hypothetical protein
MDLGELSVTLKAVFDRFNDSVDKAKDKLKQLGSEMRELVNKAAKLGAAAVAAGAAIVAGLVKAGLDAIDTNAKLARSLDGTIDGLRGLQLAGHDAGVEMNVINDASVKLTARLGDIQRQGGPAAKILEDLGLNAAELSRLDIDQKFAAIADAMRAAGLSAAQQADALRQLGIEQKEVIALISEGGDAIRAARLEVDEFGISVSAIDAAKIEAANDAMHRIWLTIEAVRNAITIALAPVLEELAERFNDVSKANGGFKESAMLATEATVRGFGKVLDVLHALKVVLKGGELIGVGFGAAMVSVAEIVVTAFVKVNDTVIGLVNKTIDAVNMLPGVDIATIDPFSDSAFYTGFKAIASDIRDKVGEVRGELHDMAMEELPNSGFEKFLEDVRDRANEAAQATVNAQRAIQEASTGAFGDTREPDTAAEDRAREMEERTRAELERKLDAIREYTMTAEELEQTAHDNRLAILDAGFENELVSLQEHHAMREELEAMHNERISALIDDEMRHRKNTLISTADFAAQAMARLTSVFEGESRKSFENHKKAAVAAAIVSTYAGAARALQDYPPPLSFAMAAAQAAFGLQQVQSIRAQSFGGGGAAGVSGGAPATPAGGGTTDRQVMVLEGINPESMYSGRQMRGLAERLNEFVGDGGKLVFG